jgi:hypothetical protein
MSRFLLRMVRPMASVLALAGVLVSSAECLIVGNATPEQHACCAAMKDCEKAMSAPCCESEVEEFPGFVATKRTVAFVPVVALLATLTEPAVLVSRAIGPGPSTDRASTGPPGVPTYLFVSSFRI